MKLTIYHKALLLFSLFFFIFLNTASAQNPANIAAIWANEGGDKVTQDELRASNNSTSVINSIWNGSRVQIFGAKNEVVSFNLVLEAPGTAATNVTVIFDSLIGPQNSLIYSIPAEGDGVFNWVNRNIELFYIRYLEIKGISTDLFFAGYSYDERHLPKRFQRPWTGEGQATGTWEDRPDHNKFYPDIAVPLELVRNFDINAGQNQSIWVDIYIPKNVLAGLYQGTIKILENGNTTHEIPVELEVRDFALPDEPYLKTMVYLGYEDINYRYLGEQYPEQGTSNDALSRLIRDRHFQLAHRHKLSLIDGNERSVASVNWEPQDRPHEQWIPRLNGNLFTESNGYDGPGVGVGNNVFSIGTYGDWWWQGQGESAMRSHCDNWANWFDANSPETEYFLYLIDESDDYEQIQQWAEWINNNPGSGQKLLSMATIPIIDAEIHTPALDIPTSWFNVGLTEKWNNAVNSYLQNPEKKVFLYNSNRPATGSFATEDDGVALRVLAWSQYKMKIDRWFYWESTYYYNFQGDMGQTNVFQTAHTFGGFSYVDPVYGETGPNYLNGDGVLFYPGTDLVFPNESYDVKGPFASLRMKLWRRGIQDVDYLAMAEKIDSARVKQIVNRIVPKVLWEIGVTDPGDPTWVFTNISWSTDPDVWESAREELADIIESGSSSVTDNRNAEPMKFTLRQNYPNPFNSSTTIPFSLVTDGYVTLKIFNLRGESVATLVDQKMARGSYSVSWNAKRLNSGIYYCRLKFQTEGLSQISTKKLLLLK